MIATARDGSLVRAFADIPDHRRPRGRVYPLPSLLTFAAAAMLCGCRSLYAIAQWGRDYNHLAPLLGLTRRPKRHPDRYRTPCVGELHAVFAGLDVRAFEAALTAWVLGQGVADLDRRILHIDGKMLRGSQGHRLPGVHLLAAYAPAVEAALAQLRVPADTNEHKAALELLKLIPLGGTVITGDAAFTQRDVCEAVVAGGGDYFLAVKENQPTLLADIRAGFARAFSPPGAGRAAGRG
jgi:hypothetical protein